MPRLGVFSEIKETKNAIAWTLTHTWSINSRLLMVVLSTGLIRGLSPAGLALVGRGLINAAAAGTGDRVFPWLIAGSILALIASLSAAAFRYSGQRLTDELDLEVVSDVMKTSSGLEFATLENTDFQEVMHETRQNAALHFSLFIDKTVQVASNSLTGLSLFAVLIVISPWFFMAITPAAILYLYWQLFLARKMYREEQVRMSKWRWTYYYVRNLTEPESAAEVRLLGLAPLFIQRFRELLESIRDRRRGLLREQMVGDVVFTAVTVAIVYVALFNVIRQTLAGQLTIGDIALFAGAAAQVRMILQATITGVGEMRKSVFHIFNLIALYNLKGDPVADGDRIPERYTGRIEIHDVSFTYPGRARPSLQNVTLTIQPGETIALVGENGAGKTTLIKLLGRLYTPTEGTLLVDGLEIRHWRRESLNRRFSFVMQNFCRYETSAAENIAFGNWKTLLGRSDDIVNIARAAGIHEMVADLPRGYETRLGSLFGEHTLSGGQWQQIALARAFARENSILILDEPTANLDAMTEYRIFTRFKELARNRTAILVSHRFSTVSMADRIVVMEKGRIVESGTHAELVSREGHYAVMYHLQQQQFPPNPSEK